MVDQLTWLGKKEELEFREINFRGHNSGKIYQYSNHVDALIRTRAIIFAMTLLVLYPVLMNYLGTNQLNIPFLIERLVFSFMLLISGLLFNKLRILSIIIAAIPMLLIIVTHLFFAPGFNISVVGFLIAILLLILSGLYYNYKVKSVQKELSQKLLENQLIANEEE
jgi:hypothetical protein